MPNSLLTVSVLLVLIASSCKCCTCLLLLFLQTKYFDYFANKIFVAHFRSNLVDLGH